MKIRNQGLPTKSHEPCSPKDRLRAQVFATGVHVKGDAIASWSGIFAALCSRKGVDGSSSICSDLSKCRNPQTALFVLTYFHSGNDAGNALGPVAPLIRLSTSRRRERQRLRPRRADCLLHLADVEQLLGLLDRLVDSGKSVIVIEHHQAVMAHADWIIDLGPGAGHDGGRIVFEGTPADLVAARPPSPAITRDLRRHLTEARTP